MYNITRGNVAPLRATLTFDDNLSYTTLDGLHPNNLGYSLIVKEWLKVLGIVYNKLLS